jgi:hypothetical protein
MYTEYTPKRIAPVVKKTSADAVGLVRGNVLSVDVPGTYPNCTLQLVADGLTGVNIPRNVATVAICGTRYVNVNVSVIGSVPTPYSVGGGVPVAIVTPVTLVVIVGFPYASLAEMTMLYKSTIGMAFGAVLVSPDIEALDDRSRTRVNVPIASAEPLHTY